MGANKLQLADKELCQALVAGYLSPEAPYIKTLAQRFRVSVHTVREALHQELGQETMRQEHAKRLRYTKTGSKNPMFGKRSEECPNYVGHCEDGRGYLTKKIGDKRYFVHRTVFAELLGLHPSQLPVSLHVHHIDGDSKNNDPNNLALVTAGGHRRIHFQ
uniref:HNH endonuclease n=1 Tax=Salibaculum sp. TaxID=2855480 RepID=UPI0038F6D96B